MEHTIRLSDRSTEDVLAAAKVAGITPSTTDPVQLLHFTATPNATDDIMLLQLTKDIAEILEAGDKVVIKGRHDDEAVLCTRDSTHDLRVCETSNSLLLCPALSYPSNNKTTNPSIDIITTDKEVLGRVSSLLEVKRSRPKLGRLQQLLLEAPYRGPLEERLANEEGEGPNKYTLNELLMEVQASENEILKGLKDQQACLIDGYWRVLDVDYRDEVMQQVVTLLEEQDWAWSRVPLEECCEKLSELHPPFVVRHVLECYGTPDDGAESGVYRLDEDSVCKFYAEVLLRPAGRFNYEEFIECWQQSVPAGMNTDLAQLQGLALRDMTSLPPVIWYYPMESLPIDPAQRFAKLFGVKDKWTYKDLEPYIRDLVTSSVTLNSLLLKYTRVSTANGVKLYNSKT